LLIANAPEGAEQKKPRKHVGIRQHARFKRRDKKIVVFPEKKPFEAKWDIILERTVNMNIDGISDAAHMPRAILQ